ncbi:MAG: glycerol-3-phosphate acyltransferase PlsY [Candidatus Deianiraeaceae bacterium]|jgi:glycerol-3-phosphate acyltransferase PlsY
MLLYCIPLVLLSYIIGSIPFGLIIAKVFYKVNLYNSGSKNIGATNVTRTCGKVAGIVTFFLDFYKGIVVLLIAKIYFATHHFGGNNIFLSQGVQFLICVGAILGHSYSIFLKFKGGKAVAISFACIVVLYPLVAIGLAIFWLITFAIFNTVGLSSVVTAILLLLSSVPMFIDTQRITLGAFFVFIAMIIIYKHTTNIKDIKSKLSA